VGQLPGGHARPSGGGGPRRRRLDPRLRRGQNVADPAGHVRRGSAGPRRRPTTGSCRSTGTGSRRSCRTRPSAEVLKPYYRYRCKRPCFHDEYLAAFNLPNVTSSTARPASTGSPSGARWSTARVPRGLHRLRHRVRGGAHARARRAGHEVVGRGGVTLAEKWADGAAGLFGMMTRGFPNLFIMPAPGQQAVVTVNYTQLAVLGAELVAGTVDLLRRSGSTVFDVDAEAEQDWGAKVVETHVDGTAFLAAAPPRASTTRGAPSSEPAQRQLRPGLRRLVRLPGPGPRLARGRRWRVARARGPGAP
jgi:cation diffusion facilitator CzcD-associated flavoprotein CzcO